MRYLMAIFFALVMTGCVTTGWETVNRDTVLVGCSSSLALQGVAGEPTRVYCSCMADQIEEAIPEYDEGKAINWIVGSDGAIAAAYCAEEVKQQARKKLNTD